MVDVDECVGGNGFCLLDYECVNIVGLYCCWFWCFCGFFMIYNEICIGNYYIFFFGYCIVGVLGLFEIGVVYMMLWLLFEMFYY